ncbi:MAG TPA: endonuclease [Bacteroidales bacterium]|nr:endonuclease [Bacteroidales bacterium]
MFYNVENTFDIYNDSITSDDEFLPDGDRRWNVSRYKNKISSIYKTIVLAGGWSPPEVIGLCEVENRKVIQDVINTTHLSEYSYDVIHQDSPDPRGIDVCLMYRKDCLKLCSSAFLKPAGEYVFKSRFVLYAKMVHVSDTIHFFINHWPSRRGGILSSQDNRLVIASMVREKADSICKSFPASKIIITGDFNCNPDDPEMRILCNPENGLKNYYNLSDSLKPGTGTYRYKGVWEKFDQVIITKSFFDNSEGLKAGDDALQIIYADFLLTEDPVYPGKSPNSTFRGFTYKGGVSDHLPVILNLRQE